MKPHSVAGDFSVIPKGATNFQVSAVTTFDSEQRLEGLIPHAHNIASSMRYSLIKPDGSRKTILEIPHWDFNWQQTYYFRTPIDIPPNSQIEAVVTYNNSGSNPKNPNNPPMDVWNGESSTDEMFLTGYLLSASKLFDPYEVSFFEFLESMARSRFLRALSDREYRYSFSDDGSVFKKADPSSGISEFKFKSLIDEDAEDAKDRIKKDSER